MLDLFKGVKLASDGGIEIVNRPSTGVPSTAIKNKGRAFDSDGRLYITTGSFATSDVVRNGVRFTADGAVYVTYSAIASDDVVKGFRRTASGRVYLAAPGSSDGGRAGLRVSPNGSACLAGVISSPAAWFRFNTGITVTGSGVSQWSDQSGNSRHLLQGTDTNRPALESDGTITFDGNDNFLKCDPFTLNQPTTVYLLAKQVTWTLNDRIFDGNANGTGAATQVNTSPIIDMTAGSAVAQNSNWTLNTYAAVVWVFNGASSLLQVNNTTATTGNAGSSNMGGFTLGAAASGAAFSNKQIKEAVLYATAHDATQRGRMIAYLAALGNLSV